MTNGSLYEVDYYAENGVHVCERCNTKRKAFNVFNELVDVVQGNDLLTMTDDTGKTVISYQQGDFNL